MRWTSGRRSQNVEDQRGRRAATPTKIGLGGLVAVGLIMYVAGMKPGDILQQLVQQGGGPLSPGGSGAVEEYQPTPEEERLADMVAVVLADTEDVWSELFAQLGRTYEEPRLVLFSGTAQSACGYAQAAMGPFYCPADRKAYIDLSFYQDLRNRHHAPGDFAQAYVIAHEIGHHVQNLLGTSDQVHRLRGRASKAEVNQASVRLELQADFFAGLWAHHADRSRQILEEGDVEEALTAATAIGDDRLQQEGRGYVVPDSFTHGTSAQRVRWFRKGLETGDLSQGDTFALPFEDL